MRRLLTGTAAAATLAAFLFTLSACEDLNAPGGGPSGGDTGSIRVTSSPSGARVFFDGSDTRAVTPHTVSNVSAGSHTVRLTLAGYRDWGPRTVTVTAGGAAVVDATLEPDSRSEGALGLELLSVQAYRSAYILRADPVPSLPARVDLSRNLAVPGNQGRQGSCVGWAVAYALKTYHERVERGWPLTSDRHLMSPAFVYNQIAQPGGGAFMVDAFDVLLEQGVSSWAAMPYDQDDERTQPSDAARAEASKYRIANWGSVLRTTQAVFVREIKRHVAAGDPVIIGIPIYPDFDDLSESNPVYDDTGGVLRGAHAIVVVGYDDARSAFKVVNSWGTDWGIGGYGWIDYDASERLILEAYVTEDELASPVDEPPIAASSPSPGISATEVAVSTVLSWTRNARTTSFDVYLGTDRDLGAVDFQGNLASERFTPDLAPGTTYFWRIDARGAGGITRGAVWTFTTAGSSRLPGKAVNPRPSDGATQVATLNTVLAWDSGGHTTSYDVYFGTNASLGLGNRKATQGQRVFRPGLLVAGTRYYWRVDAKNGRGVTRGDVWSFTAQGGPKVTYLNIFAPANGHTFTLGESIRVQVVFGEHVSLSGGDPSVALTIGSRTRYAYFGSSTFRAEGFVAHYLVQQGDLDTDGVSVPANAISLNGGTLTAVDDGVDADLRHAALPDQRNRKVDGTGSGGVVPAISIADARVAEGNSGTKGLVFGVTLSSSSSQVVTVAYSTSDSTAVAGSDYTATSGSLTFSPGDTSKTINVSVRGDTDHEPDETFSVKLMNPTNATLSDDTAVGTIRNDDAVPSRTIEGISCNSVQEGDSGTTDMKFRFTLSSPSTVPVSVWHRTEDETGGNRATAGTDYTARSGRLTIAAGETSKTIAVKVLGDTDFESDELVAVRLSDPVNATFPTWLTGAMRAQCYINNDDNRAPTVKNVLPDVSFAGRESHTVDLSQYFSDADGDTLAYAASAKNGYVWDAVSLAVYGNVLTLTGVGLSTGSSSVTVTASDGKGGQVADSFDVAVTAPGNNHAPHVTKEFPDVSLSIGNTHTVDDVVGYFTDSDGDYIHYSGVGYPGSSMFDIDVLAGSGGFTITVVAVGGDSTEFTVSPHVKDSYFTFGSAEFTLTITNE